MDMLDSPFLVLRDKVQVSRMVGGENLLRRDGASVGIPHLQPQTCDELFGSLNR